MGTTYFLNPDLTFVWQCVLIGGRVSTQQFCHACCSAIYGLVCFCLRVCGRRIPEHRVWTYLIQIAEGLQYIHSRRILHRDLKVALILQAVVDLADPAAVVIV